MSNNNKKISKEEEAVIVDELNKKYGERGSEWEGGIAVAKGGVERFYAVQAPSNAAYIEFKKKTDESFAKVAMNKINKVEPLNLTWNLVADSLITDVTGVASLADLKHDFETKVRIVEMLGEIVYGLSNSGLDGLKKS